MMRNLIILVVVAGLGWSAYWYVVAQGWNSALNTWLEDRRADGWQADWADLTVRGFPNRIDTTLTELALADVQAGWAWTAPVVQILSLSYRPTDVIVALPTDSVLQTTRATYALHGDKIRASVVVEPSTTLALVLVEASARSSDSDVRLGREMLGTSARLKPPPSRP